MTVDPLRALAAEIRACTACPLHRSARQAVPGDGSGESGIFFLGEAPGYDEVGACDVWLRRHLEVLKPRVIVTLGRHAMYKFFPTESISRIHGRPRSHD